MKKISQKQVLRLHSLAIEETGGIDGVRDNNMLDSALQSPFQTFTGDDIYPTIESKAARLCYSLINNHPFLDGNKRIGILILIIFLEINEIIINCNNNELIDLGLGIASGQYDSNYIESWIISHK
jgi:death-on-curing protein